MKVSIRGIAIPTVRYRLKARIFECGFKTFIEFSRRVEVHPTYLSRILNGWDFPSPTLQKRMAEELGLTFKEMRELL